MIDVARVNIFNIDGNWMLSKNHFSATSIFSKVIKANYKTLSQQKQNPVDVN
jgi:hypothetical protein